MPNYKVLIVEDNVINQRLLKEVLKRLGHSGVVVGDGLQALQCLQQNSFDLVIIDIQMPVMDGVAAISHIRQQEATTGKYQKIIIATAHDAPDQALRCERAGANGYVCKPVRMEELKKEMNRVMA